jgi:hypothetical protein
MERLGSTPQDKVKNGKVRKALRQLRDFGPSYPSLNSHKYQSLQGPGGEELWESYVENHTTRAWRIWWIYGPHSSEITIVSVGPHPD